MVSSSDYLMHLVEHCFVTSILDSKESLFEFQNILDWYKTCYAVVLDFSPFDDINRVKSIITNTTLQKRCISTEKESIRQEYNWSRDVFRRVVDKVGKIIYDKGFSYNRSKKVSEKVVEEYFNRYIRLENCVITNNQHNIVFIWKDVKTKLRPVYESSASGKWETHKIQVKEGCQLVSIKETCTVKDVRLVAFLEFMFNSYGFFFHRMLEGQYFFPESYQYHFPKHSLIFWPQKLIKNAVKELENPIWLESGKKWFLQSLQYWEYKICFADFLIHYGLESDIEMVKKIIEWVTSKEVAWMFWLL